MERWYGFRAGPKGFRLEELGCLLKAKGRACVGVIDRALGVSVLFTAAITPTVFHSAYSRLSLINDTVVLTPSMHGGGRGPPFRVHDAAILITGCTIAAWLRGHA